MKSNSLIMGIFNLFVSPTVLLTFFLLAIATAFPQAEYTGITRNYRFNIILTNVTRLGFTKSMVTVNGHYPGPKIIAREGDRVVVKVVNKVPNNVTLHWHGIRQLRSGWSDGPAYIAQCPIQTGRSYVYNFTITGQRGTLFWHAHISWLRATVYGPIVILPKPNQPYPFVKPYKEITIMFGEWFNADPESIIKQALKSGGGPNVSDAYTINGFPGPLYNMSKEAYKLKVKPRKTYLLRLINTALNDDLFFSIANHTLTIVEADAVYVKPFESSILHIGAGQTTNVLLVTKLESPNAKFYMLARPYSTGGGTFDNSTVAGFLQYTHSKKIHKTFRPTLPPINATDVLASYITRFRSLASEEYPANVPQNIDKRFFFTVGLGTQPCPKHHACAAPHNMKFAASINNVSFILPKIALLKAHYYTQYNEGIFSSDFPVYPLNPFNYTGNSPNNTMVSQGTKVVIIPFNTSVELVLQDTSILGFESHPLHLHGYNFYIVGQGFGNYDPNKDPANFNFVDPVERNTVTVPSRGWVALRFRADNPGVWFMHCHFDAHMSWGLMMAWIVMDGELPNQKLPPPPPDYPMC